MYPNESTISNNDRFRKMHPTLWPMNVYVKSYLIATALTRQHMQIHVICIKGCKVADTQVMHALM